MNSQLQIWDLWYPQAGATGLPFARGRLDATKVLLVHAPPPMLTVEVRSDEGQRLAYSQDLAQTADSRRTHRPRRFVAHAKRHRTTRDSAWRRSWKIDKRVGC